MRGIVFSLSHRIEQFNHRYGSQFNFAMVFEPVETAILELRIRFAMNFSFMSVETMSFSILGPCRKMVLALWTTSRLLAIQTRQSGCKLDG
jgi:hypothetical protein